MYMEVYCANINLSSKVNMSPLKCVKKPLETRMNMEACKHNENGERQVQNPKLMEAFWNLSVLIGKYKNMRHERIVVCCAWNIETTLKTG